MYDIRCSEYLHVVLQDLDPPVSPRRAGPARLSQSINSGFRLLPQVLVNAEQVHEPRAWRPAMSAGHTSRPSWSWPLEKSSRGEASASFCFARCASAEGTGRSSYTIALPVPLRHTVALTGPDIKLLAQVLRVIAMLSPYSLNMNVALAKARGELSHTSRRDGAWD